MKNLFPIILGILMFHCSGCAFISIPLTSRVLPLEETTVRGKGRDKILIIDISGTITSKKRESLIGLDGERDSLVARVREELKKASTDDRVKAVILRINSPGGTVTASDIIYQEVLEFRKHTNVYVVACLMEMATSGAYLIANAADAIIAHPTTVTGSIGVIAMKFNFKGLMDKIGIQEESIMSGDKKDMFSYFRSVTDEERKMMREIIDDMYGRFLAAVDQGRKNLTMEEIKPLADGRIFTAGQALDNQMIDGIGYLDDVIGLSMRETGMTEARVVIYDRPGKYKSNIYSQANINIFGLGEKGMDPSAYLPVQFMYLWNP